MKKKIAGTSLALLGWLLLSALNLFVVWALRDRARLIRDNDNERIISTLFTEMRNYSDMGSAIESNPALSERISGAAIYGSDLQAVYQWGEAPLVFEEGILEGLSSNRFGRYTIPDRRGRSAKFVIRFGRMPGVPGPQRAERERPVRGERREEPRPERSRMERRQNEGRGDTRASEARAGGEQGLFFFNGLSRGRYFYTDISHPAYWRTQTLTAIFFPLVEILLLFLVFYIRHLYLQSREYREKIEAQQNLVVLGTAAGTLAHEIKNPLLSIRLQTGILEKTAGAAGKQEIDIINQEVDRLSSLVYRVNDYLREPAGEPAPIDICRLLAQTAKRVCGTDVIGTDSSASDSAAADSSAADSSALIFADENRIRSVLENILRNACESGSPVSEIGASVKSNDGKITVTIFDRGKGMANEELQRAFDPFYTTKSSGTGIGLAISKRFTEAAGGSISVENREGGGLAVTLVFPQRIKGRI